jgi:hypothetical protein
MDVFGLMRFTYRSKPVSRPVDVIDDGIGTFYFSAVVLRFEL